jgi:hypothetical protein
VFELWCRASFHARPGADRLEFNDRGIADNFYNSAHYIHGDINPFDGFDPSTGLADPNVVAICGYRGCENATVTVNNGGECDSTKRAPYKRDIFVASSDGIVGQLSCQGKDYMPFSSGPVNAGVQGKKEGIKFTEMNHEDAAGSNGNGWGARQNPVDFFVGAIDSVYGPNGLQAPQAFNSGMVTDDSLGGKVGTASQHEGDMYRWAHEGQQGYSAPVFNFAPTPPPSPVFQGSVNYGDKVTELGKGFVGEKPTRDVRGGDVRADVGEKEERSGEQAEFGEKEYTKEMNSSEQNYAKEQESNLDLEYRINKKYFADFSDNESDYRRSK